MIAQHDGASHAWPIGYDDLELCHTQAERPYYVPGRPFSTAFGALLGVPSTIYGPILITGRRARGVGRDPSSSLSPMLRTTLVTVLRLRAFVRSSDDEAALRALRELGSVSHVAAASDDAVTAITADVHPEAAEKVLEALVRAGVAPDDLSLTRQEVIAPVGDHGAPAGAGAVVWAEVLGEARVNARPLARYLCLMAAAGVIAAFGVIDANGILIVGAMAVSPDLLPLCAACISLQAGRLGLAGRALVTLFVGLVTTALVAGLVTAVLDLTGWLDEDFKVGEGGIGVLANVDLSTVLVALAAGVAAVVAFETRASAAVGVAISVTTIPAAAYLGVAAGVGQIGEASGALAVLGVNVSMLLIAGTATVTAQRWARRRASARPEPPT